MPNHGIAPEEEEDLPCFREVWWIPVSVLISCKGEKSVQLLGNESQPVSHITEICWLS